jgi:hypothetical protein
MPIYLMFLAPAPTAPMDAASGQFRSGLNFDYSRTFFGGVSTDWVALIDMELAVIEFSLEYQPSRQFRMDLHIPLASMNGGGLDKFVEEFHDTFGLPNDNRNGRPRNQFGYTLRKDGQDWISPRQGGLHLADSRLGLEMALLRSEAPLPLDIDLQYILKLPIGDADAGFGSGNFDHGLFLPMQATYYPWFLYLMPGGILTGTPDTLGADVEVNPMGTLFIGIEYAMTPAWSLLGQLNFYTSPLGTTGIEQLDEDSIELVFGTIGQLSRRIELEVAFCEDLSRNAPDFTLHIGLCFRKF